MSFFGWYLESSARKVNNTLDILHNKEMSLDNINKLVLVKMLLLLGRLKRITKLLKENVIRNSRVNDPSSKK